MKSRIRLIHRIVLASILLALLLCLTACQESTSSKYERANKLLTEGKYTEAAAIFDEISTYEDASKMSLYAKAINAAEKGDYDSAFSTFTSLGEFKDCPMMITYYKGRQNEATVYDDSRIHEYRWFDAIELYESIPLFRDSKERAENCREAAYDQAIKSGDEGNASFAVSILKKLGTYSDASKQVIYYQAVALLNQGDYSGASSAFSVIPGFRDADNQVTSTLEDGYKEAAAKEEAGELDEANAIFLNLGAYKDSADRAYKLYYNAGLTMREAENWNGARSAFSKAGEYSDATEQIKETTYQEASALEASGDQEGAYKLFIDLQEYKDSYERANKPYYDLGIQKMNAGEWIEAITAFSHAGNYSDANIQISEANYLHAITLMKAKDYTEAAAIMINLKGYKDVDTLLETDENLAAAVAREAKLSAYREAGNVVTFGTYPQTKEGTDLTPIEWIVLDYDEANQKTLLISKYGLDAVPYNEKCTDITWEQCTLRTWLNGEFLNKAFGAKEQSAMLVTSVDNSSSQGYSQWNTDGGNNTQDQVFLLSYAEANFYFGVKPHGSDNKKARVVPTAYAIAKGTWVGKFNKTEDGKPAGGWWLRSPSISQDHAAYVDTDGSLRRKRVDSDSGGVRPAFWLNLESDIF